MNATRAATIRLRSSFDGAVSLGRVQTPTLAILTRREEEIRAFTPEKYWLVDAAFRTDDARAYEGRYHAGAKPRLPRAEEAEAIAAAVRGRRRRDHEAREDPPHREGAAALQPDRAAARGEHALRLLGAAHARAPRSAATRSTRRSPTRAPSRASCPGDQVPELKETAGKVGAQPGVRGGRRLRDRAGPAAARPRRQRREGRRPPRDHPHERRAPPRRRWGRTTASIYDLVARRFLAVFHPDAEFENTRIETTVADHVFRTRGKVLIVPGWRGVYGELARGRGRRGRGPRPAAAEARARRAGQHDGRRGRSRRRPSRRGATPTPRCWA